MGEPVNTDSVPTDQEPGEAVNETAVPPVERGVDSDSQGLDRNDRHDDHQPCDDRGDPGPFPQFLRREPPPTTEQQARIDRAAALAAAKDGQPHGADPREQQKVEAEPAAQAVGTDTAALQEHANAIRELRKQTIENVIEIGRRLVEAKRAAGPRAYLGWLEAEFGWTDRTALNYVRVYEMARSNPKRVSDLNLPLRTLYLLAAPSTPEKVRDEVFERAEAGEPITTAAAKKTINKAKSIEDEPEIAEVATEMISEVTKIAEVTTEAEPVDQEMKDIIAARERANKNARGELDESEPEVKKPTDEVETKNARKRKRGKPLRIVPTQSKHGREVEVLHQTWELACESARAQFLQEVTNQANPRQLDEPVAKPLAAPTTDSTPHPNEQITKHIRQALNALRLAAPDKDAALEYLRRINGALDRDGLGVDDVQVFAGRSRTSLH